MHVSVALLLMAVLAMVAGCVPVPPPINPPTPVPTRTVTVTPVPEPSTSSPSDPTYTPTQPTPEPPSPPVTSVGPSTTDIWQWAIGRNVWTDPLLQQYTGRLGEDETEVNVQSDGFKLVPDAAGTVISVIVFNDENTLGYPGSSSSFRAYQGSLPLALSWTDTADTVASRYPEFTVSGGNGLEYVYSYQDGERRIDVTFAAAHTSDLPDAPIHSIAVS